MLYLRVVLDWKKGGKRVEYHRMPDDCTPAYIQFWFKVHLRSKAYKVVQWELVRETSL